MKLKGLIIAIMLLTSTIVAQAQSDALFSKLSDNKDITTVFISKSLLQMVPDMASKSDIGGADIGSLVNKLDQLEIYTTEKAGVANTMKVEADKFVKNKTFENLMTVKEGKNVVNFLISKSKDKNVSELIMIVATEPSECTIIRITGSFTMEDIQKVVADKGKK